MSASATDYFMKTGKSTATTLSAPGYTVGNTSINVGTTAELPTDTGIFIMIDEVETVGGVEQRVAGTYNVFRGTVSSGTQISGLVYQGGDTNRNYSAGATTRVYMTISSYHTNRMIDALLVSLDQDGTLKAGAVDNAAVIADGIITPAKFTTALKGDWNAGLLPAVSSVTENGNRSADITFASTVASLLTPGMRIRTSRTVAAPTYMGGAFNGTNHYFTKTTCTSTLSTVTDNFTVVGYVEPTAYQIGYLCGRADSTPTTGFWLRTEATGQVSLGIFNAGVGNYRFVSTQQSLPLNKKTHIAASWAAGVVVIYFDGVSVPVTTASTSGTAPTAASAAAADFSIGRNGAVNSQYFAGYLSGFGVFNAVLSAATIRSYKNQVLSGSETNCIGAWSLNNTAVNQQAAGTNDLTATNSVGYTSGRSPYCMDATGTAAGTYDFGIVTKVVTAVATIQYPEGCAIPTSGGISTVDYSGVKAPFGMPVSRGRWRVEMQNRTLASQSSATEATYYNLGSAQLSIPVGQWAAGYGVSAIHTSAAAANRAFKTTLSTANNTELDRIWTAYMEWNSVASMGQAIRVENSLDLTAQTIYYLNTAAIAVSTSAVFNRGADQTTVIYAELAYL